MRRSELRERKRSQSLTRYRSPRPCPLTARATRLGPQVAGAVPAPAAHTIDDLARLSVGRGRGFLDALELGRRTRV